MDSKQRLRPWLEAQINNGEIPGLCWLNEDKTKFRIPWKHGGKQDWNPDSSRIFKEWARHTGRFREGIDEPDYVKWKTRLRCAFNKAPDIEEVKDESQLEGPDPYRVYILKPRKNGKKTFEQEPKVNAHLQFKAPGMQTAAPLPAVLDNMSMMSTESFPSDLKDLKSADMLKIEGAQMSMSNVSIGDVIMLSDHFQSLKLGKEKAVSSDGYVSLILKIFYCRKEVMDKKVTAPHGCRLYYSTFTAAPEVVLPDWIAPLAYETDGVDLLCLPPCHGLMDTSKLQTFWQTVLEKGLIDGICLASLDGDIYALRFCSCQIFYASETGTSGEPVALKRQRSDLLDDTNALTKIFDYKNEFLPAFKRYCAGLGPKPSSTVYLFLGLQTYLSNLHLNQGICITVDSAKALEVLGEFCEDKVISNDEKCALAILECEDLMKSEKMNNPQLQNLDWTKYLPTAAATPENFNSLDDLLCEYAPVPAATDDDDSCEASTLDFNDLCELGLEACDPYAEYLQI